MKKTIYQISISSLFVKLLLLLFWVFSISACNAKNEFDIGDGGFISDQICSPPCFMSITPGITNKVEAIEILKAKGIWG